MIQDIEYNGLRGSVLRIFAKERPALPAARPRREEITVPGRDGSLYVYDGGYEPAEIQVQFNYIGEELMWAERWRTAQEWLSARNAKLRLSDDDGYFYWISYVDLDSAERASARIGNFEATFVTRDGLQYLDEGQWEHDPGEIQWNPYETAHPVYKINGEGKCTLTVNGKKMTANVGQNLTIDTVRMLSYREDGTLQNTSVSGDYEELYLVKGENSVSVSSGFELKVIPNWRRL